MEDGQELVAGITQRHLNAATSILHFYEQYLWRFTAPSKRRTQQILEVQLLLIKIQLVSSSKIGAFTPSEIDHIVAAIYTFVGQTREKIPPSESRDAVIGGCEELRDYLVKTLTPPK